MTGRAHLFSGVLAWCAQVSHGAEGVRQGVTEIFQAGKEALEQQTKEGAQRAKEIGQEIQKAAQDTERRAEDALKRAGEGAGDKAQQAKQVRLAPVVLSGSACAQPRVEAVCCGPLLALTPALTLICACRPSRVLPPTSRTP